MTNFRSWALTACAVALLAACGGDDLDVPGSGDTAGAPTTQGTFTAVVSFGDSLSDIGTYAPATSVTANGAPPYFGGKFTINGPGDTIWLENLAARLGIVVTPAEVGFAGVSQACPAAAVPALASTCTSYGQGGALVTNPLGINNAVGALTVPVKTQIARHLARFTSFSASDLILIWGGNNEAFVHFTAFGAAAAQIQADAGAGRISADEANLRLFQAQTAAQAEMKKAAQELTSYIRTEILAKGGRYVAVMNLIDSTQTPFGSTLSPGASSVLTALVDTFNLWLRDGLTGQPVRIIDMNAAGKDVAANPATYGIVNNTLPACDTAKITAITNGQDTTGSSLFCNSTAGAPFNGLRTGADPATWAFADSVHPSPGGHKIISDYVTTQLRSFGWIS